MKSKTNRFLSLIVSIVITALLLTGAVPSFAWTAEAQDSEILPAIPIDQRDAPEIEGASAIVMDIDTGTVLYEKNADKVREPASITKIVTCLLAIENLPLDKEVTVPEGVEIEGSTMGLVPGEKITVEELLYGMMLPSGNDAAEVLAEEMADDFDEFGKMMEERAAACGAEHSVFKNPNGLNEDRSRLNYTTARDLALISREAMQNPEFRKVVGTAKHTVPATNKSEKRKLENSNICLWSKDTTTINGKERTYKYKGCTGIKTGFTSDAGNCFVGSAKRHGTEVVMVTLNTEDPLERYDDGILLWDYALKTYETYKALKANEEAGVSRVRRGEKKTVPVGTAQDLGVTILRGTADQQNFTTEFQLDEPKVTAPVKKGQKVGTALVFNEKGRLIGKEDLYTLAAVGKGGPLSYIGIADEDLPEAACIAAALILLIIIVRRVRRGRRRKERRKKREEIRGELATMRTVGVGMTPKELHQVTGKEEEIKPIDRGPARISDEELTAWTSTARAPKAAPGSNRFGGRSERTSFSRDMSAPDRHEPGRPSSRPARSRSDEELFALLEGTKKTEPDEPRTHAGLTWEELLEVMSSPGPAVPPSGKGHSQKPPTDKNHS